MTRLIQKDITSTSGTCFPTCIAMATGIDPELIPNFCGNGNNNWINDCIAWANKNDLVCLYFMKKDNNWYAVADLMTAGYPVILGGQSPRFPKGNHAVLWYKEEIIDPHPRGGGIIGDPIDAVIFIEKKK